MESAVQAGHRGPGESFEWTGIFGLPSHSDLKDLFETMMIMERDALALAARRINGECIAGKFENSCLTADERYGRNFEMRLEAVHENCSGCGVCRLVCAIEKYQEVNPAMALLSIEGRFPSPGHYQIHLCDQCGLCAGACPVDAIGLENGIYVIDPEACTACMLCVEACPHGVMREHRNMEGPAKCDLCGKCVRFCPRQALVLVDDETEQAAA